MCVCKSSPGGGATARHSQWSAASRAAPHGATARVSPHGAMLRCAALALLCAALAHADRPKRAEMSPVPFVMGSRYGRSPERVMAPRNDRFFMGSRYGKRSGGEEAGRVWAGCAGGSCRLLCRLAAAPSLYKCVSTRDPLHYNRSGGELVAAGGRQ